MSVATIFNVPTSEELLMQFSFANSASHLDIIQALFSQKQLTLIMRAVDPIPTFDMGAWAYNHQSLHNDMNSALNLLGNDLTSVDFNDPEQLASWIDLHAREHLAAQQALGI